MGISKKRLLSIINATKCPTDTESSDSGSEVEKIEGKIDDLKIFSNQNKSNFDCFILEHISLEEISSDSNDELSKPKKKKKRGLNKGITIIQCYFKVEVYILYLFNIAEPAPKGAVPSTKPTEQNGENAEKQYSVLELLELQARARAIRSQLALEPVTKIELDDSDAEIEEPTKEKQVNQNMETVSDTIAQKDNSQKKNEEEQSKAPATRPLRLKRNFRQRQVEGYESDENQSVVENEKEQPNVEGSVEKEESAQKQKSPIKESENAAPAVNDDDVVPIIAEPEVLCISSSDSESDDKSTSSKVKKYINMPVVEKVDRPPTDDELFLLKIKGKSEGKLKNDIAPNKDSVQNAEKETIDHANEEQEMEDGEIVEEDEIVEIGESPERPQIEEKTQENENVTTKESIDAEITKKAVQQSEKKLDKIQESVDSNSSSSESEDDKKSSDSEDSGSDTDGSEKKTRSLESRNSKKSNADDDDDDIIDLGKDEDLDFEQLEMSTEEPEKVKSPRRSTRSKSRKSDEREKSMEEKVKPFFFKF